MTEEPPGLARVEAMASLWQACVDQPTAGQELPEQQFNTWIKPLAARGRRLLKGHHLRRQPLQSWTGFAPSTAGRISLEIFLATANIVDR